MSGAHKQTIERAWVGVRTGRSEEFSWKQEAFSIALVGDPFTRGNGTLKIYNFTKFFHES